MTWCPGNKLEVYVVAKGGGSEAKSKFAMLNPSDSVVDWVWKQVPKMGAGWCPPGILGIGIGGTADKAMALAKKSLLQPIDIQALQAKGQRAGPRSCGWNCTTKSIDWGSVPRDWAD